MIGAGVFAVFGPAAQTTGALLLVGLVVAAVVAYCNAVASAQLAAAYPTSGGTYIYGRQCLGRWWGFTAGWGFVVDKIASAAAMVLALASYAVPEPGWGQRLTAVGRAAVFAFGGYARVATMDEEVRDPARTIPRAIPIALAITGPAVSLSCLAGRWLVLRRRAHDEHGNPHPLSPNANAP
jgi:APA family basic amino acid/polyamine antiporter